MAEPKPDRREFPNNPFWAFSLRIYGKDGVAPACLRLQERHSVDVNILLFACWCAIEGPGALSEQAMRQVVDAVSPWHDRQVRTLRRLRVELKTERHGAPADLAESLRNQIKAGELLAERIEQTMLYRMAEDIGPSTPENNSALAEENMSGYLAILGVVANDEDRSDLAILRDAA